MRRTRLRVPGDPVIQRITQRRFKRNPRNLHGLPYSFNDALVQRLILDSSEGLFLLEKVR